ncbi:MAG: aspartyl-phosphate phosphatase Spo0E family protein [Pelosinus sp.]|nr:aspartyl-phosphate phosphatase Spo0E family protein [Pelosinus sp.]
MDVETILLKIEYLRKNMHEQSAQVNNNLLDKSVIQASQLLDKALNEYFRYINTPSLM